MCVCRVHRHAKKSRRMREHKAGSVQGDPPPPLCVQDWDARVSKRVFRSSVLGKGDSGRTSHAVWREV